MGAAESDPTPICAGAWKPRPHGCPAQTLPESISTCPRTSRRLAFLKLFAPSCLSDSGLELGPTGGHQGSSQIRGWGGGSGF